MEGLADEDRNVIVSGMRWTWWLSILSAPFGYASQVLLARASPSAIGAYGILNIYIAFVNSILLFGGNTVVIRFLPGMDRKDRMPFLLSYLIIVAVVLAALIGLGTANPGWLAYVFGEPEQRAAHLKLLWFSPVLILWSFTGGALRGAMDLKGAQLMQRALTAFTFVSYGILFAAGRQLIRQSPVTVIFFVFFAGTVITCLMGLHRSARCFPLHNRPRFYLPKDFWPFSGAVQFGSIWSFCSTRLDQVLLVGYAGVVGLGHYYALISIVTTIPLTMWLLTDSFFPSLTSAISKGALAGCRSLTESYLRLLLPLALAGSAFLSLFGETVVALYGRREYHAIIAFLPFAAPVAIFEGLNAFASSMLAAVGRSGWQAVILIFRTITIAILFPMLWNRYGLAGAVASWCAGIIVNQVLAMVVLRRVMPFEWSMLRPYTAVVTVSLALTVLVVRAAPGLGLASLLWVAGMGGYLVMAGYTREEILRLTALLIPARKAQAGTGT